VTYLIGEIVLYLFAALTVGGVAGWLLRSSLGAGVATSDALPDATVYAADIGGAKRRAAELARDLADQRAAAAELEARGAAQTQQMEALTRRLADAERRVQELEHERALQNRALQVLHQQLELAVERRAPAPRRKPGAAA
jgi:septal ring factor EnvC (AmiA/AmiB activator)